MKLHLPSQEEKITRLLLEADRNSSDKRRDFQLKITDIEIFAAYVAAHLSGDYLARTKRYNPGYFYGGSSKGILKSFLSKRISAEQSREIEDAFKNDPHLQKTMRALNDIFTKYYADIFNIGKDRTPSRNGPIAAMQRISRKNFFVKEFLPQAMLAYFDEGKKLEEAFASPQSARKGIAKAFQVNAFISEFGSPSPCPVSQRFYQICALAPARDPKTGAVSIIGREAGALLAFIYNEFKHGKSELTPHVEERAEPS